MNKEIAKMAESLDTVHTHTHTHTQPLFTKYIYQMKHNMK